MKKFLIPIGALLLSGFAEAQLSTTENYVYTKTYLDYNGTTATKTSETVQYFDGLGRPKQVVNVKASPLGRDVVTPIEYDGFGRQVKDYLPIPQGNTLNGAIVPNPLGNAVSAYGGEKIFSEKTLEDSPLDRLLEQRAVGNDWNNKPVKLSYEANTAGEVKKYVATFNYTTFTSSITLSGSYGAAQLYKNTVTDEDGNKTIEFKNGQGQTLLVRKINGTENVDTYYVYNDYNQLAYVISPLAAVSGATDEATLNNLCYQYKYDGRNRLVEKKLPGKGWEYMVYDKQDRLVLTQDANLREKNQWLFTKYDQFSRPVYTGISYSASGRIQHVAAVESFGSANESRTSASWNSNGIDVYYTKSGAYPNQSNFTILTVNYYDAYFTGDPFPSKVWNQDVLPSSPQQYDRSTKGLPVIKLVKNIEDDGWTKTYFYYDLKGRPIREYIFNHLGGYTNVERQLDFSGNIQIVSTQHKRLATDAEKLITESFEYDHQNRLLVHKHKVDSQPEEILAQNKYNELSQLENKKVGGTNAASPLQSIDYAYNIRGWMTRINDPKNLNGKLFGYEIKYADPDPIAGYSFARFNGNISQVNWKAASDGVLKNYSYQYDGLNRLIYGAYIEPLAATPVNEFYSEAPQYDLNGNIVHLNRNTKHTTNGVAMLIDNLDYSYVGNRLISVKDISQNSLGYPYLATPNQIEYDDNGNIKVHKDKMINEIVYNYLNLPSSINMLQRKGLGSFEGNMITHKYRSDGVKLEKTVSFVNPYTADLTYVEYLDGFQYERKYNKSNTSQQANDSGYVLQFVPNSEGYFDFVKNKYIYNYTDHLGNVRMSYLNNGSGIEVLDESNYYPFGLMHIRSSFSSGMLSYTYRYNGKELQRETGMYDYGARFYMPDLGRWGVVDPFAEQMTRHSPYNYAFNNPIRFIDPDGRMSMEFDDPIYNKKGEKIGDDGKTDNKAYIVQGKVESEVKKATKKGENYTGSLAENEKVIKLPTDGVAGDIVDSVNDTVSEKLEHGGHANKKDTNATRWDAGAGAEEIKNDDGETIGARATISPFKINGSQNIPLNASNLEYWWHVHPDKKVGDLQLGASTPSPSDKAFQGTLMSRGFRGNTFVVGARDQKVTFYNRQKSILTIPYATFKKVLGK